MITTLIKDLRLFQTIKRNRFLFKTKMNTTYVDISNASDIGVTDYTEFIDNQKQNKATKSDRLKIGQYVIQQHVRVRLF